MADEGQGMERLSPDKLVLGFSRTKIMLYLLIAVLVHIAAVAATSVGYIRDRWIDPEAAVRRKTEPAKPRAGSNIEPRAGAASGEPTKPPAAGKPEAQSSKLGASGAPDDARKETPVVKGITELPKKDETPKQPDDLGISIDETNK